LAAAVHYAGDNGARVINLSLYAKSRPPSRSGAGVCSGCGPRRCGGGHCPERRRPGGFLPRQVPGCGGGRGHGPRGPASLVQQLGPRGGGGRPGQLGGLSPAGWQDGGTKGAPPLPRPRWPAPWARFSRPIPTSPVPRPFRFSRGRAGIWVLGDWTKVSALAWFKPGRLFVLPFPRGSLSPWAG